MNIFLKIYVVIPAYEPDGRLLSLLESITRQTNYVPVIVDDGSGPKYAPIFRLAAEYGTVITHEKNFGKGDALKTAYAYIEEHEPGVCGIVTADADGQHSLEDIVSVANCLIRNPEKLILGSRKFRGKVPFKSRFGNLITRNVFWLASGLKLSDTQTGLRAFHSTYLEYMQTIPGMRYEYEMNVLSYWARSNKTIYEHPIQTIYIDDNSSSHFHALRDSCLIYKDLLKFGCSSFVSFLADYFAYSLLLLVTGALGNAGIILSNVLARIFSGSLNYTLNKKFVFQSKGNVAKTLSQYILLAITILVLNTVLLTVLVNTIVPNKYVAKILVECFLFLFSLIIQKKFIFHDKNCRRLPLNIKKAVN